MAEFFEIFLSLITLTVLEVVLGIDNLIFLAIITQRLPKSLQKKARRLGLTLAWVTRLLLLGAAVWLTKLTTPLFGLFTWSFSARDLFLILGGMFLLAKSTQEIHSELEPTPPAKSIKGGSLHFQMVIVQIALLDIIFSLDSVLTVIGLTRHFWLMATSITIAIILMIVASESLSRFVNKHPTIKMLALSFLMLIGTILIADGFQFHIPRGYIYFAMSFSVLVETLNMIRRKKKTKLKNNLSSSSSL